MSHHDCPERPDRHGEFACARAGVERLTDELGRFMETFESWARALFDRLEELEKEPVVTLPDGRNVTLGELVDLHLDLSARLQRAEAVASAFKVCESSRGSFSCSEPHDCRCPKFRASKPEEWKGEWKCECGREELDAAFAAWEEGKA